MPNLLDNLSFTVASLVDILLVATFVYYILYPLKGTRSARIAFGIIFLILLYFLSDRFQLQTMAWLLQNFMAYIMFAIIVIFQADIRKALASFGRNPFLDFFHIQQKNTGYLIELQRAVNLLAQRNIGALIVIERELDLKNLIETGLHLDAEIKSELLLSIFNTRSPLHDGAVILANGRILSAGAILPLSSRTDIDESYGTRHRAALGLSEESDAVIVVVSEEHGNVSVALDGTMETLATPLELERRVKPMLAR
ncbi:MAG: TIGR00159 family protein [Candidatus Glassbacteria bacterium RIFCSPLOWO2_12_FULL_58_11]|uniref:Diadenylate cyclase n=1 Tax=Candidatus Glassbacteria bacterium RIFCSPLOWO2_12_FULL_58_11 TaxID=1817867 RepID=A0A1F5YQJ2_9BACT|nr:MAG: TIGR00159 family protein [Candidatus Glassbacteria bacterium RIFCSPLOWO2_12_FULL_58_11]